MKDAGIRVPLGCGNQAALGVAEVSIRERGFRALEGGAGGFATGVRAGGAAGFAATGATFFAGGAGRGAAARAVLTLAGLAAFFACGLAWRGFGVGFAVRDLDTFAAFVGLLFPTDFFLEDAAAVRPAFFPFAAGIAAPFPFLPQ